MRDRRRKEKSLNKKKKIIAALSIFFVFFVALAWLVIAGGVFYFFHLKAPKMEAERDAENQIQEDREAFTKPDTIKSDMSQADIEEEDKKTVPLIEEAIHLTDVYAEEGDYVSFFCYDPEAVKYQWEIYNVQEKQWEIIEKSNKNQIRVQEKQDELQRQISEISFRAQADLNDLMIKCTVTLTDQQARSETASLFLLTKTISKIRVEDQIYDIDCYVSARELPVLVTYEDGTEDCITGLNNLYFIKLEEKKEQSQSVSGNYVETTITTSTEDMYMHTGEAQEITIRYHPQNKEYIEEKCVIEGKDLLPPTISDVFISPFEVISEDKPVCLSISISADDNDTPYPYLEYAFLYAEQTPMDDDWNRKANFDVTISRNGKYIAYCKDQAGNIATLEKELIVVDAKPPRINDVSLQENEWCTSNTILVSADDASDITYRFKHEKGTWTDWLTYSEYVADQNGKWIIQVKDAAGNISETEIIIDNIDHDAPVIKCITIKK